MAVLRVLAGFFLLFAAIALAADVTRTLNGNGGWVITSFAGHWRSFSPQMFAAAQKTVSTSLHPFVWDPVIVRLISLPAWFLLGAIGLTLGYLGRQKRRVNIFIN